MWKRPATDQSRHSSRCDIPEESEDEDSEEERPTNTQTSNKQGQLWGVVGAAWSSAKSFFSAVRSNQGKHKLAESGEADGEPIHTKKAAVERNGGTETKEVPFANPARGLAASNARAPPIASVHPVRGTPLTMQTHSGSVLGVTFTKPKIRNYSFGSNSSASVEAQPKHVASHFWSKSLGHKTATFSTVDNKCSQPQATAEHVGTSSFCSGFTSSVDSSSKSTEEKQKHFSPTVSAESSGKTTTTFDPVCRGGFQPQPTSKHVGTKNSWSASTTPTHSSSVSVEARPKHGAPHSTSKSLDHKATTFSAVDSRCSLPPATTEYVGTSSFCSGSMSPVDLSSKSTKEKQKHFSPTASAESSGKTATTFDPVCRGGLRPQPTSEHVGTKNSWSASTTPTHSSSVSVEASPKHVAPHSTSKSLDHKTTTLSTVSGRGSQSQVTTENVVNSSFCSSSTNPVDISSTEKKQKRLSPKVSADSSGKTTTTFDPVNRGGFQPQPTSEHVGTKNSSSASTSPTHSSSASVEARPKHAAPHSTSKSLDHKTTTFSAVDSRCSQPPATTEHVGTSSFCSGSTSADSSCKSTKEKQKHFSPKVSADSSGKTTTTCDPVCRGGLQPQPTSEHVGTKNSSFASTSPTHSSSVSVEASPKHVAPHSRSKSLGHKTTTLSTVSSRGSQPQVTTENVSTSSFCSSTNPTTTLSTVSSRGSQPQVTTENVGTSSFCSSTNPIDISSTKHKQKRSSKVSADSSGKTTTTFDLVNRGDLQPQPTSEHAGTKNSSFPYTSPSHSSSATIKAKPKHIAATVSANSLSQKTATFIPVDSRDSQLRPAEHPASSEGNVIDLTGEETVTTHCLPEPAQHEEVRPDVDDLSLAMKAPNNISANENKCSQGKTDQPVKLKGEGSTMVVLHTDKAVQVRYRKDLENRYRRITERHALLKQRFKAMQKDVRTVLNLIVPDIDFGDEENTEAILRTIISAEKQEVQK